MCIRDRSTHVAKGRLLDRVVVAEQGDRVGGHGHDLLGPVPVPGVGDRQRQPEALRPRRRGPQLLGPGHLCDVVVLDAGQVPDQPRDRVRPVVDTEQQLSLIHI